MDLFDFSELSSKDILNDWAAVTREVQHSEEIEAIQQIIADVCCQRIELFAAGKKVECLNSRLKMAFPPFLMRFVNIFNSLPNERKNYTSAMFFLKFIDASSSSPDNPVDVSDFEEFIENFDTAVDIAIKDLLENAVNLYPKDGLQRKITARDLLDSEIMCDDPEAVVFKEKAFLKLKEKLMKLCGEQVPPFERKLFEDDVKGITKLPSLNK